MAEAVRTDQKAGWCSMCRGGSHGICSAPKCACPGKSHPNRPSADRMEAAVPAPAPPPVAAVPSTVVRWEDPPVVTRGRTPGVTFDPELIRELSANPGRWARIDTLKSKSGAASRLGRFKKGVFSPVAPPLWEATARRVPTGSAFYLRFVGSEGS